MSFDDDVLPDVSFDEIGDTKKTDAETETETRQSPRKTNSILISTITQKINDHKEKIKKHHEYVQNKKEIDDIIKEDGFNFDRLGNIVEQNDSNEKIELDPNQENVLKRLLGNRDPLIPLRPKLESHFDFENFQPLLYLYPIESCTEAYLKQMLNPRNLDNLAVYITNIKDPIKFAKFFKQIPSEELKRQIIDSFILNVLTISCPVKIHSVFTSIIMQTFDNKDFICSDWYFSGVLFLKFLLSIGLKREKFEKYFPNVIEKVEVENSNYLQTLKNNSSNSSSKVDIALLDLIFSEITKLLRLSLKNKSNLYKESELDLIFCLTCFFLLDNHLDDLMSFNQNMAEIFSEFYKLPNEKLKKNMSELFQDEKVISLCNYVSNILKIDELEYANTLARQVTNMDTSNGENNQTSDDKKADDDVSMENEQTPTTTCKIFEPLPLNNIFHKIVYLLSYLNTSKFLKIVSVKLTFICLKNFFFIFTNESDLDKLDDCNIDYLIELLKKYVARIFSKCSYSMYNIIEFISIIYDNYIYDLKDDKQTVDYSLQLKETFDDSYKQVRDHIECQGRVQVKVMIQNFTYRCEFHSGKKQNGTQKRTSVVPRKNQNQTSTTQLQIEEITNEDLEEDFTFVNITDKIKTYVESNSTKIFKDFLNSSQQQDSNNRDDVCMMEINQTMNCSQLPDLN